MLRPPASFDTLENYTDELCKFVATPLVRQITGGIHVNDALIHGAWEKLPRAWTDWWAAWPDHRLAQQDLIDSIDENAEKRQANLPEARPESLRRWLNTLNSLALSRARRCGTSINLPDCLKERMKAKKIAEVSRAAAYIHDVCLQKGISRVIDMGSGRGYLSISLAFLFPQLRVLSIDGSESQIAGSRSLAKSLGLDEGRLEHMVHWIDGSSDLAGKIQKWADKEDCMLVGLHACGNLSEHMIRYFATISRLRALAVVGCCYDHVVARSSDCPDGFPISSKLRERNVILTPTALMTGCQAPNNWKRADENNHGEATVFSKRRLYRAMLEKVFHDKGLQIESNAEGRPVWGTRKGDLVSFVNYAQRSMACLGISIDDLSADELQSYERRYSRCQGQITILWTLSMLCCKVIESIIAMDRYWFLKERQATNVDVLPIFDVRVSPRNLMIVADKEEIATD